VVILYPRLCSVISYPIQSTCDDSGFSAGIAHREGDHAAVAEPCGRDRLFGIWNFVHETDCIIWA